MGETPSDIEQRNAAGRRGEVRPWVRRMEPVSKGAGREARDDPRKRHARRGGGSNRLSGEGHRADALAPGADERRDKLRKAAGRGTYPWIRGCLNGETRRGKTPPPHAEHIGMEEGTRRTETSK